MAHTEQQAELDLVRAIALQPNEDAPRLVYADWLLERGNAHGELIQIQCALAAKKNPSNEQQLRAREAELLTAHQEAWLGSAFTPLVSWDFDRGFATGRFAHAGLWVAAGEEPDFFRAARFFMSKGVVDGSIGSPVTLESFIAVCGWLKEDGGGSRSKGLYEVTFAVDAKGALPPTTEPTVVPRPTTGPPAIRYSTAIGEEKAVAFAGTVNGGRMALKWYSHINGADGEWEYVLEDVPGVDGRTDSRYAHGR